MLALTYMALALGGCLYIVIAGFLGYLLPFGDDASGAGDVGSDAAGDGADYGAGGHGKVMHAESGASVFHFPLFSPLAVSTLLGSLGAYGLITKLGAEVSDGLSLLISTPAAVATAYAATFTAWKIAKGSIGSSMIRVEDLVGLTAEVITPIAAGGVGEVAAIVHGQRYTSSAKAKDRGAIPRGTTVTIVETVGTTMIVTPRRSEGGTRS